MTLRVDRLKIVKKIEVDRRKFDFWVGEGRERSKECFIIYKDHKAKYAFWL